MDKIITVLQPFLGIIVPIILLFVVLYILFSFSLMIICKNKKIKHSWLSWIPFVNLYVLARVTWNEIIGIIFAIISFIGIQFSVILDGVQILYGIPIPILIVVICLGLSIVTYFICIKKAYEILSEKSVLYFILTLLSLGLLSPIFLFLLRKKDSKKIERKKEHEESVLGALELQSFKSKKRVFGNDSAETDVLKDIPTVQKKQVIAQKKEDVSLEEEIRSLEIKEQVKKQEILASKREILDSMSTEEEKPFTLEGMEPMIMEKEKSQIEDIIIEDIPINPVVSNPVIETLEINDSTSDSIPVQEPEILDLMSDWLTANANYAPKIETQNRDIKEETLEIPEIFSSNLNTINRENQKMNENIINVVGTMFFINGKLLIDKPRKRPTFQMIGGKVDEGETILEAAKRECHEELGPLAIFDDSKITFVMDFIEIATSNPNQKIHMHIFQYTGELQGKLSASEEIENFMWFGIGDDHNLLSNTLKNEIIPYAIKQRLIY